MEIITEMAGGDFLTALDLNMGFHHMELTPEASEKLSFVVESGQYQWDTLPMGPCNGPQAFQAAMGRFFSRVTSPRGRVRVFVDDVAIRT